MSAMYHGLIGKGALTSSEPFLKVKYSASKYSSLELDACITNSDRVVGLMVEGTQHATSGLHLTGYQSNTFTGNVEVSGWETYLILRKSNGAIAIRSDILVRDEAILRFEGSNQLLKTSNVTLRSHGSLQSLSYYGNDLTNTFQNLIIEDNGVVYFNHNEGSSQGRKNYIYIDDLIIHQGGILEVQGWQEGRDFLLVQKTGAHLADALGKMRFTGYDPNAIHLEEFNSEYWSISSAPEPATTGALLGAAGLGLLVWRRKRRTNN